MSHSCVNETLSDRFQGTTPGVRQAFAELRRITRQFGPVTIYAQKSRIVFMVRVRFLSVYVHKTWLGAGIWLKRRGVTHPALYKVEDYKTLGCVYYIRLESPAQVDPELIALLRECYAIGRQEPA